MSLVDEFAARVIRASTRVDAAFRLYERLRSGLVVRFAGNGALDAYNDLAYGRTTHFTPGGRGFIGRLFAWEEELTERYLPRVPARILIGGTGGGREALAWAARGYEVVGFEPSVPLARSMAAAAQALPVRTLIGRYEDLPHLTPLDGGPPVDLRTLGPFGGAIFGMGSYSHLRNREARIAALREMAQLTAGPVLFSFSLHLHLGATPQTRLRRIGAALGFQQTGDSFSPQLGFYHLSTPDEIESEVADAGLAILASSDQTAEGQWPWVVAGHSAP
jgi:hypothetical protein